MEFMKAYAIKNYGADTQLQQVKLPVPEVRDNEVLVKICAASVNPVDFKIRNGLLRLIKSFNFPLVLGFDFSGIVQKTGKDVHGFRIEQKVYGCPRDSHVGTFCEYRSFDASDLAPMPSNLSFEEAAALPLTALTVYQTFHQALDTKPGDRVLIHAGSGGVGIIALQYAKHLGLHTATTTSSRNIALVKELGADEVIDYTKESFEEKLSGFDAVIDTLGGDTLIRSFDVIKRGGVIVTLSGMPNPGSAYENNLGHFKAFLFLLASWSATRTAKQHGATYKFWMMHADGKQLREVTKLVEQGTIRPIIDRVYDLDDVQRALEHCEAGHTRGKVVIHIHNEH